MSHSFKFFRAGGFDQVRIDTAADLLALKELDQKLWVALSCPVKGIEFDTRTLALIDTDNDGHLRAPELLAAIDWAAAEGWNPGLYDADSFYAADPCGFFMAELNGEPAGCISAVAYDDSFGFMGFYIVRKDLRKQGERII